MMNRIFLCAIVQFCILGYALGQVAQINKLNVQCDRSGMKVNVEFDSPFNGIVFSKGHYSDPNCRHVRETSSQTSYEFYISSTRCGTIGTDMRGNSAQGFKNVIIIQHDPEFQDVMDSARKLSCDWVTKLEKYVTFAPFGVDMLGVKELRFPGDTVDCWMDIQRGHGPFAPAVGGVVPIGEKLTVVIYVRDTDNSFDVHVKDCYAYDSPEYRNPNSRALQLTDERGCPVKEKLVQGFFRTKDVRNSGATVIAYGLINAFKFPEKMDVFLACNVEVCKGNCPNNDCQPEVTVAGSDEAEVTTAASVSSTTEASTDSEEQDEDKEEETSEAPSTDDDKEESSTEESGTATEETESSEDTSEAPKKEEKEDEEDKEESTDEEEEKSEDEEKPSEEKADSSAEEGEEKTEEKTEDASEEAEQTKEDEEPVAVAEAPEKSKAEDDEEEDEDEKKAAKLKISINKKSSKKAKITTPKRSSSKKASIKKLASQKAVVPKKSKKSTTTTASKKPKSAPITKTKKSSRSTKTNSKSGKLKASASLKQSRAVVAKKPRRIARAPSSIPEHYARHLIQVNSWNNDPSMYQFEGRHIRSRRSVTLNDRENATFPAMMHSISIISPIEDLDEKELDAWEKMAELEGKSEEVSLSETLKQQHGITGYCFSMGGLVSASVLFAAVVMILSMSVHMVFAHLQTRHSDQNAKVASLY